MKTLTENASVTYASSNDPRLDFLFHVIEGSSRERTVELLEKSWQAAPLDTMKLVMNCRDIRCGKAIRAQFLISLQWLYERQFSNLLLNLACFEQFGCWKDYLNLLLISLFGELPHDANTEQRNKKTSYYVNKYDCIIIQNLPKVQRRELSQTETEIFDIKRKIIVDKHAPRIESINKPYDALSFRDRKNYFPNVESGTKMYYKVKTDKAKLKMLNHFRRQYFDKVYKENENFKVLYDKIVELFAKAIFKDYTDVRNGKLSISLASKWLPNPRRHYDKYLFILAPIARKFFEFEPKLIDQLDAAKRNEDRRVVCLFRKVYTELRQHLQVPEIKMSERDWDEIDYKVVPSVAMLKYRICFTRHDLDRFEKFVKTGSAKAGAITPADLVQQLAEQVGGDFDTEKTEFSKDQQVALDAIDNQWQSLLADVKSKGSETIGHCLAVCDVSGSMMCSNQKIKPMYGAIGLTLFLMQLSETSWNKSCIAFSEEPTLHQIDTSQPLLKRVKQILSCPWGMNTSLNKVFDLILSHAKTNKMNQSEMPQILFIFTDMEFDSAMSEKTNFEVCQAQFQKAGYSLPLIVFWNLKGEKTSRSTPVQCKENGVILLSGFSAQTFNLVLGDLSDITPLSMLLRVINDPRYDCIRIIH